MEEQKRTINFSVMMIGEASVGKSSLMNRLLKNEFIRIQSATIGSDIGNYTFETPDYTARVQIWDTAGQERYRSLTYNYYSQANGIMMVYDITSRSSIDKLELWIRAIREKCRKDVRILLVGNKKDDISRRQISCEEGEKLAREEGFAFFETSAKEDNDNVKNAFDYLIQEVATEVLKNPEINLSMDKIDKKDLSPTVAKGTCC